MNNKAIESQIMERFLETHLWNFLYDAFQTDVLIYLLLLHFLLSVLKLSL